MFGRQIAVWKPKRRKFVTQLERHALRPLIGHHNYGINVFEGCRIYTLADGTRAIFRWDDHKQRLIKSADAYGMPVNEWPFTTEQLWDASIRVAALNEKDCYLRPCVYIDGDLKVHDQSYTITSWAATRDWDPDTKPYLQSNALRLLVTDLKRSPPQAQTSAKGSANYVLSWKAKKLSLGRCDDALVMDSTGRCISEGSGYSILFYDRATNIIWAPGQESSALDSITVQTLQYIALEYMGINLIQGHIPLTELYTADEIFVAGTAIEVMGVGYVEELATSRSRTLTNAPGPVTQELRRLYREVVTGQKVLKESWYTRLPSWSRIKRS